MRTVATISFVLIVLAACESENEKTAAGNAGTISFHQWLRESSVSPSEFDAVAFIMDGTCPSCQTKFEKALTKTSRRVLCVSCDPETVRRYRLKGIRVHYDSICRMEYLALLSHQTTVVYPKSASHDEEVVVIDPQTVGRVMLWMK